MDCLMFGVVFLICVHLSLQATDNGVPSTLTVLVVDVELNETEHRRVQLTEGGGSSTDPVLTCTPDPGDSDPIRAYIVSASPTTPCGSRCFSLQPCGSGGEYCLFYHPGVDTLSVADAPRYTLTLGCTDDAEIPVAGSLSVTVISNTPPVFVPASPTSVSQTINGLASPPGTIIYEVSTSDVDNDFVNCSLSLSPESEFFNMMNNGRVETSQDLRMFCMDKITANIMASDQFNSPIGPFTLDLYLDPNNEAPTVSNLDTTVRYREKPGIGYTVLDLAVADTTLFDTLNIHMWADSPAGMELYNLSGTSLVTKLNPKYVREDLRSIRLHFLLDDGFCSSPPYSLTVELEDYNERPRVYATQPFLEVYEGQIDCAHNIEIIDEEQTDNFTYTLSRPNELFGVNPITGNIVTETGISIGVGSNIYKDFEVNIFAYDDGGRRSDEANVLVRVYDINDHPPYFTQSTFFLAAQECMEPGSITGQLEGKDDDSDYNQNNFFYFGGGGNDFTVMATGDVVLKRNCSDGETFSGIATIQDQGIYPGPLTGDPATVLVTCGPCIPTTTASFTTASVSTFRHDVYVCLIVSAILGMTWLSLTVFLALKSCCNHVTGEFRISSARPKKINVDPEIANGPSTHYPRSPQRRTSISRNHPQRRTSTSRKHPHRRTSTSRKHPQRRTSTSRKHPQRRSSISTKMSQDSQSVVSNGAGDQDMRIPPLILKPRRNTNPFLSWIKRDPTESKKHQKNTKEQQPRLTLPNGFDPSKRPSALSIVPLTDVESVSNKSEARNSIHSLTSAIRENPKPVGVGRPLPRPKEDTSLTFPNGFDPSKRPSALSIAPLTDVETVSTKSEARDSIHSLMSTTRENTKPAVLGRPLPKPNRESRAWSFGITRPTGIGRRDSLEITGGRGGIETQDRKSRRRRIGTHERKSSIGHTSGADRWRSIGTKDRQGSVGNPDIDRRRSIGNQGSVGHTGIARRRSIATQGREDSIGHTGGVGRRRSNTQGRKASFGYTGIGRQESRETTKGKGSVKQAWHTDIEPKKVSVSGVHLL